MSKEYIEREKVIEVIKNYGKNAIDIGQSSLDPVDDILLLQGAVNMIPAADVIVPPCKVGDKIYQLDTAGDIYESEITQMVYETKGIAFDERAIGKKVFLTIEEAKQALAERSGDNGKM